MTEKLTPKRAAVVLEMLNQRPFNQLTRIQKDLFRRCTQVVRSNRKPISNPGRGLFVVVSKGPDKQDIYLSPTSRWVASPERARRFSERRAREVAKDFQDHGDRNATALLMSSTNPLELGFRRKKTGKGYAVQLGVGRSQANPKAVIIYHRVLRVEAQKGPGHRCDGECKRKNHCYYHDYSRGSAAVMYGLPDGSVLIKGRKRLWGMF